MLRMRAATIVAGLLLAATIGAQTPVPADEGELARLEATLQAQEGLRAAKRLQNAFSQYRSEGLWNDLAELLTTDATGVFGPGMQPVEGRDALRAHFMIEAERSDLYLTPVQLHTWLNFQPIVTLAADGRTVLGTWHEVALLGRVGVSAEWRGGVYENEYRLEDGVWKISRIRYFPQFQGDYDAYGHQAPPAWNIPYHFDAAHVGRTFSPGAIESLAAALPEGRDEQRRLNSLAGRIATLTDETAVQNLEHSFGYYLDRKLWDDVVDLFADDARFEAEDSGARQGKAEIRQALEEMYGPEPIQTGELFDHIFLGTVVTIAADGQSATTRSTVLSQLGRNGEFARWELGNYQNLYVKDDGVWKISSLRYLARMGTDYDLGWAADADPWRPITVGFQYPNPGTSRAAEVPERSVVAAASLVPATLARDLGRAIAIDAVENLNSSYGYYIDESAWDNMAATFASVGSKEITGAGVYVGPDRIRTVLNLRGPRGGRSPGFFTIHQLVQPVIHVSDDGLYANARLRLFQMGGNADGSSGSWIGGIYENTAFFENGEWKFGRQDLHHLFNASYRNGWARVGTAAASTVSDPASLPTSGPEGRNVRGGGITQGLGGAASPNQFAADFPPDGPIRAKQYAFPEITEPAFHYANPVSGRMPADYLP